MVARVGEALLALFEHLWVDVDHVDLCLAVAVPSRMLEETKGNVARAAGDVEARHGAVRVELAHKVVLPQTVNPERHGVVHDIVRRRDGRKDVAHCNACVSASSGRQGEGRTERLFGVLGHVAEAKVGLRLGLTAVAASSLSRAHSRPCPSSRDHRPPPSSSSPRR